MITIQIQFIFNQTIKLYLPNSINVFKLRTLIFNNTSIPVHDQIIIKNNQIIGDNIVITKNVKLICIDKKNYFYQNFNKLSIEPYRQLIYSIIIAIFTTICLIYISNHESF